MTIYTQYKLEIPYFVSIFEPHKKIKSQLMEILSRQKHTLSHTPTEYAMSDWYIDNGTPREYWDFLFPMINNHMIPIFKQVGFENSVYANFWTSTYSLGGKLDWHVHRETNWASIYFVDLPNKKQSTLFKTFYDEVFQPEVEEGMILTFPSNVYHSSPASDNSVKTIIAFNIK